MTRKKKRNKHGTILNPEPYRLPLGTRQTAKHLLGVAVAGLLFLILMNLVLLALGLR